MSEAGRTTAGNPFEGDTGTCGGRRETLSEDLRIPGVDVDQCRNLQALLLQSASERPRTVVIHENGTLLKLAHSKHLDIIRPIDRVERPREAAESVYRANPGKAEFVAVFERRAIERYFAQVQDGWRPDELVNQYERRVFDLLAECGDGIVTYYDRLEAASVLLSFPGDFLETPLSMPGYPNKLYVSEETLGLGQPVQIAKADRFMECYNGLKKTLWGRSGVRVG